MQKALKALLTADEPLGASEIIEQAGISERSYTRNIEELAAVGMVESLGDGGHKKWRAWIIPWWSPLAGVDAPRMAETDENAVTPPSRWDDVLYEIAHDLGLDFDYELFAGVVDVEEVFAALPALERWRGFIKTHYGFVEAEDEPLPTPDRTSIETAHKPECAEIGACPAVQEDEQLSLADGEHS
jgi:hypothetical protein